MGDTPNFTYLRNQVTSEFWKEVVDVCENYFNEESTTSGLPTTESTILAPLEVATVYPPNHVVDGGPCVCDAQWMEVSPGVYDVSFTIVPQARDIGRVAIRLTGLPANLPPMTVVPGSISLTALNVGTFI